MISFLCTFAGKSLLFSGTSAEAIPAMLNVSYGSAALQLIPDY